MSEESKIFINIYTKEDLTADELVEEFRKDKLLVEPKK